LRILSEPDRAGNAVRFREQQADDHDEHNNADNRTDDHQEPVDQGDLSKGPQPYGHHDDRNLI